MASLEDYSAFIPAEAGEVTLEEIPTGADIPPEDAPLYPKPWDGSENAS